MMRGAIGAAVAATLLGAPATAMADVMQIGVSGAEWIAGGPAGSSSGGGQGDAAPAVDFAGANPAESVQQTPLAVENALHVGSITQAPDAAGPARWRARIAQLAAKYDISPALLEAVVWQESRWNEAAVSPAGARGLAQLMPGTAVQMGVDADDPTANLEGGARYLRMQLDAFHGDVEKALAAYNAGPARVEKAGGIPNIRETRAYVAAIMSRLTDSVRQ